MFSDRYLYFHGMHFEREQIKFAFHSWKMRFEVGKMVHSSRPTLYEECGSKVDRKLFSPFFRIATGNGEKDNFSTWVTFSSPFSLPSFLSYYFYRRFHLLWSAGMSWRGNAPSTRSKNRNEMARQENDAFYELNLSFLCRKMYSAF